MTPDRDLFDLARTLVPRDLGGAEAWQLLVRAIGVGWIDRDDLGDLIDALGQGKDYGAEELLFTYAAARVEVSLLDDQRSSEPHAMLRALVRLRQILHDRVDHLDGGLTAWKDQGRAVTVGQSEDGALGEKFARSLAAKDNQALRALLGDPIDFKALTPGRHWDAADPSEVTDEIILGRWFDADDHIEHLLQVGTGRLVDREYLAYRLQVRTGSSRYLVEQQAYYASEGDRIVWLRVLCSGFRPLPDEAPGP